LKTDIIIAGGGPAGLAAAEVAARRGSAVVVLEQNHEIGSPIRTSGGSFIDELEALGIPERLYHPISRLRFCTPNNAATYHYAAPRLCVIDVRGVFQFLAGRAIAAGAQIRLATRAVAPLIKDGIVLGVTTSEGLTTSEGVRASGGGKTAADQWESKVVIDATGYRSTLLKQAGLDPGTRRFGVGAEYDLYAPHCDEGEALLIAGSDFAPSGYAWVFPWGRHRVRVGVGIIHPDSRETPGAYLDRLLSNLDRFGVNLKGAQPVEHHAGLIPSECFAGKFAGDGILGVGDAAGQASSLVGEGIRWAIHAGKMAGEVAADAIEKGDVSREALSVFERRWIKRYGKNLRLAHKLNERLAGWDDRKWDERLEVLKLLTPEQFIEALKTNLTGGWLLKFIASNPRALAGVAGLF
jgi:digeranylgeranylglycerophospholipid reductase